MRQGRWWRSRLPKGSEVTLKYCRSAAGRAPKFEPTREAGPRTVVLSRRKQGSSPVGSASKINGFCGDGRARPPLKPPFQDGHRLAKSPRAGLFKSGSSSDQRLDIEAC